MSDVASFDAQKRWSALIDRVQRGEGVTITRRGEPVAQRSLPGTVDGAAEAREDVAALRAAREGFRQRGPRLADLIAEGRR